MAMVPGRELQDSRSMRLADRRLATQSWARSAAKGSVAVWVAERTLASVLTF